jgi:hypothetical protein
MYSVFLWKRSIVIYVCYYSALIFVKKFEYIYKTDLFVIYVTLIIKAVGWSRYDRNSEFLLIRMFESFLNSLNITCLSFVRRNPEFGLFMNIFSFR